MRRFVDAPSECRCGAIITLRDGTTAQCGRYINRDYAYITAQGLCTQHADMALCGKVVRRSVDKTEG